VGSLEGSLSMLMGLEANKACSIFLGIYLCGNNISEWGENFLEFVIREIIRKILYEKVGIFFSLFFSITFFDMMLNLNLLSIVVAVVEFFDRLLGILLGLKLNVSKTSGFSILESFEFARLDSTILGKEIIKCLLVHLLWQVLD
jgi:uncharacterized protein YacL